jgi:hypothetical protein
MGQRVLEELHPQVRRNCLVSDARYWGYFSICGLLLRLRGLYRFECGLMPWERTDEKDIPGWIEETENLWAELAKEEISPLLINGGRYGAFDVEGINSALSKEGLLYGAGYGVYMKPVFFLADLAGRERLEGFEVLTAGREYARDLSVHPAMLQGDTVLARGERTTELIWERFEEFRARKTPGGVLDEAFGAYGIGKDSGPPEVMAAAEEELRAYIYHEIGEAVEGGKLSTLWSRMLASIGGRKESAFLRAVKDTLADTSPRGMLRHITENRKAGSLAFYVSFLHGYRVFLAAGIKEAFLQLGRSGDWRAVEAAREKTYEEAEGIALDLTSRYKEGNGPDALPVAIEGHINRLQSGG